MNSEQLLLILRTWFTTVLLCEMKVVELTCPLPQLAGHSIALVPSLQKIVLFGGHSKGDFTNNLYVNENCEWKKIDLKSEHAPEKRNFASIVVHNDNSLILFGGKNNGTSCQAIENLHK